MATFASNNLNSENINKWEELHKKSSSQEVRVSPNQTIKKISEDKIFIKTNSIHVRTLEIGCGFGRNLYHLIHNSFADQYIGIDQTETAIAKSKELLKEYINEGKVTIIKANAGASLPFTDGYFDCIFDIMSAITFIPDKTNRESYFANVKRLLKPGGVYFFLAVRKEGIFNDKITDSNLPDDGLFKRKFDNMIEKSYAKNEIIDYLAPLSPQFLEIASEHTRAFGDEQFDRKDGFWFGCFMKI